ncbi:MAG: hypothetical protein IT210_13060 [Armatimonadetes bacterium]|nr:hypothetical protein [Armatimonadota bacterium]
MWIGTHDVVVQHLRFRYGYSGPMPGADPVVRMHDGAHDMILDHVSIAWAMYMASIAVAFPAKEMHLGLTSRNGHPTRVALLDCLFSHPLARGFTGQFDYSGWGIMLGHLGGTVAGHQYTLARNLFVHNSFRQPLIQSGRNQVINNLVYGTGPWTPQDNQWAYLMLWQQSDPAMDKNPAFSTQAVIVNTVTLDSDGTGLGDTAWPSIVGSTPGLKTFHFAFNKEQLACQKTSGNQGPHITGPDLAGQKAGIYGYLEDGSNTDLWYRSAPDWHTRRRFQTLAADAVPAYVTANAGARPLDRDSVDLAAVSQTRAALRDDLPHMGSRIRSQDDMGGYPVLTVNTRRLRLPAKPDAIAPGQRFRTNLEIWLERLARDLDPPMMGPTRGSYPISCQQQQPHLLSRSRQKSRPP